MWIGSSWTNQNFHIRLVETTIVADGEEDELILDVWL